MDSNTGWYIYWWPRTSFGPYGLALVGIILFYFNCFWLIPSITGWYTTLYMVLFWLSRLLKLKSDRFKSLANIICSLQNGKSSPVRSFLSSSQDSLTKFGETRISTDGSLPSPTSQSSLAGSSKIPRSSSSQLLAQRKLFAESQIGRSSFRKLLEPSLHQRPGITPYRVVLGNVKDKVRQQQNFYTRT